MGRTLIAYVALSLPVLINTDELIFWGEDTTILFVAEVAMWVAIGIFGTTWALVQLSPPLLFPGALQAPDAAPPFTVVEILGGCPCTC